MRTSINNIDNRINDIRLDINRVFGIDSLRSTAFLRLRLYCQHAMAKLCHAFTSSKRGSTCTSSGVAAPGTGAWLERVEVSTRMASANASGWQPIPALPCPRPCS